jgi:hypothetical protein
MTYRNSLLALVVLASATSFVAAQPPSGLLPPERAVEQVIDHYIDAEIKKAGVATASPADDAAFLRRVTLDLVGRIPTLAETTEYVTSSDPAKKQQLVERLMASPGFVRHQTTEFYTLVQLEERRKGANPTGLRDYLQQAFAENRPWDRIFRELMLPEESDSKTKGAGEFIKARVKDLNRLTIDTSSLFFGVNISCAQCHDHPHVPSWTQDHFYGMKSFFARTFDNNGFLGEYEAGLVKYLPNKGQEKVAPVMFLTGQKIDAPNVREPNPKEKKEAQARIELTKKGQKALPTFSLRAKLVETALTPGQHDYFARSIVNRLWYRYLGRGLVMPLDQMHAENPPSHPELLAWLARDVASHTYDLRRLIRGIVLSQAYARSSRWDGENYPEEKYFAVALVRPLAPAQLATSLKLAAIDPLNLPKDRGELEKRIEGVEKSADRLAKYFPQPGDNFQVSASEALLFANNEEMAKELLEGPTALVTRLQALPDLRERADLAVRTVLARAARPEETQAVVDYLSRRQDRAAAACQQVVWALLTSAEFRFNH